jgi:fatty-acyl-CoA synthase
MTRTEHDPATLTGLLAEQRGKGTALIYGERTWSYDDIEDLSRRAATSLKARGIGPGDRVALWLPNTPAYVILYFACARLGAVAVGVNTRFRSVEVGEILRRTGCRVLAFWPDFKHIDFAGILAQVDPAATAGLETMIVYSDEGEGAGSVPTLPGIETIGFEALTDAPALENDFATPESPCNIFTTSGTTRAPKLVLHKQSVIVRHARDVAVAYGYAGGGTMMLQTVPLCGVFGFCQFVATLAAGAPNVMMPVFDPVEAARLINLHQVTHTVGADDMADRLLAISDAPRPFPSLRHFVYAKFNAALVDIVERAEARGVILYGVYGSSEAQALFSIQRGEAPAERRKLGGGFPVSPETRVRARDRDTGAVLPHGESGELEIKAPSLMVGYDGNEEATRAAFTEDGYFRSGDLGYTLADGSFIYLARAGDALRLGGFLVNPAEIEAHLLTHQAVDGCQVVGAETGRGTAAVAFVTLKPGAAADETGLHDHCKGALAGFKVPARVFVVDAFPTTESANGTKIQRNKLREMAQQRIGGGAASAGRP